MGSYPGREGDFFAPRANPGLGHLGGIHYQNLTNIDSYCDSVEAGKAPVRRALMTTEEERFIRELILQWKLGRVNNNYFLKKFGIK